jgi:hypothetical protein
VFQLEQPDDQVGQRQQALQLFWRSTGGQQIAQGHSVSSPTRRSSESPTRVGAASQASSTAVCAASNGAADPDQRVLSDQHLEQSVEEGKQRGPGQRPTLGATCAVGVARLPLGLLLVGRLLTLG